MPELAQVLVAFLLASFFRIWPERKKKNQEKYLNLSNQLAQMHGYIGLNPELAMEFSYDGIAIPSLGTHLSFRAKTWTRQIQLAIVMRDSRAIANLCQLQLAEHIDSSVTTLPFDYAFIDFIKGIYNPDADIKALLQQVLDTSAPELVPSEKQAYIYQVDLKFINLVLAVLAKDESAFQQRFEDALKEHIKYYDRRGYNDLEWGWLPIHLHAAAAMAFDEFGYKVEVKSPYIVDWLITGDFHKEDTYPVFIDKKDLSFEIHDFDINKREALHQAVKVKAKVGFPIPNDLTVIDFLGEKGDCLVFYTLKPVAIGADPNWLKDLENRWHEIARCPLLLAQINKQKLAVMDNKNNLLIFEKTQ